VRKAVFIGSPVAAQQQVFHLRLLHVQPVLVPARRWRAFTSLHDVSLHRHRMQALRA